MQRPTVRHYTEKEILELPAVKGSLSNSSPSVSQEPCWKGGRKSVRVREGEGRQENPLNQPDRHTYELTHMSRQKQHAKNPQESVPRRGSRKERGSWHMPPSLTQRLSLTDNHLQMKTWFPPRESHKGNKVLLREAASRSGWPTEKKLSAILRGSVSYNVLSSLLDFILLFLILFFYSFNTFLPQRFFVYLFWCSV